MSTECMHKKTTDKQTKMYLFKALKNVSHLTEIKTGIAVIYKIYFSL